MTEYITREQAEKLAFGFRGVVPSYRGVKKKDAYPLCNAAIQHYRDSLVAGVVLPEIGPHDHPEPQTHVWTKLEIQAIQDYARQAIADALIVERQAAWDAVNQCIKPGDLGGDGCDNNAQRNGLILAANLLMKRIAAAPDLKEAVK